MSVFEEFSLQKIENSGRMIAPYTLLGLLLVLGLVSLPVPYASSVKPSLVLMAVYYWSIYRPTLIPPALCFGLGLLMDFLTGVPVGLNAFILVAAQWSIRDQRRYLMGQPYITIWAVFGVLVLVSAVLQWGLMGVVQWHWSFPLGGLFSALLSIFLFPLISLLLNLTHRILPVASKAFP